MKKMTKHIPVSILYQDISHIHDKICFKGVLQLGKITVLTFDEFDNKILRIKNLNLTEMGGTACLYTDPFLFLLSGLSVDLGSFSIFSCNPVFVGGMSRVKSLHFLIYN